MIIESFQTRPLATIVPSYLYQEYADDDNLQAFVNSQNALAQSYLDWFNGAPLGIYTSPDITGALLDWVCAGIYGIQRPVLSTAATQVTAGYDSVPYDTLGYNGLLSSRTGTATTASDDIYRRIITWMLYRGDGFVFNMQWLKNRVARFLYGPNGSNPDVLDNAIDITVSSSVFTISGNETPVFSAMQTAYQNGYLPIPFIYSLAFVGIAFLNNGGLLQINSVAGYPTSPSGLSAGAVWYNGGLISVVPGGSGTGQTLYYPTETSAELLASGAGGIPTTDPLVTNQLWNDGGLIAISAG